MKLNGPTDRIELLQGENSVSSSRVDSEVPLPNQPVTGEIPKTSAVCNATVKWKAKISVHQEPMQSMLEIPRETSPKHNNQNHVETPEVVITAAGSQTSLREDVTTEFDGDNISQGSTRTRHSRVSLLSGKVASAIIAAGTGTSLTDVSRGPNGPPGQGHYASVNTVNNPLLAAIPYLPVPLAWILLLFNIVLPGSGTVLAGISMLCCGSSQQNSKQDDDIGPCCTNIFVGVSQLFTVSFLLIGWIWSITWGVYMVIFAREHKRMREEITRYENTKKAADAFKGGRTI